MAVAAGAIWVYTRPEPWRPTQENWPPAQIWESDVPKGFTPPAPQTDVEWSEYRPGFQKDIDRAGDAGDCVALDQYFGEAMNTGTRDRLALTYIDRWGTHLDCPQFAEEA